LIALAFAALVRALTFLLEALAALAIAIAALLAAAVGLVAMLLSHAGRLIADMLRALAALAEHLVKVVVVAVLVVVVTWSFPVVYLAYGGDPPALLPAAVATLLPTAYATTFKPIWSGLVFAIVAAALAGAILPHLHPIALALLVGGARAAGVLHILDTMPGTTKPQEEAT
jgi:hypothetical protein